MDSTLNPVFSMTITLPLSSSPFHHLHRTSVLGTNSFTRISVVSVKGSISSSSHGADSRPVRGDKNRQLRSLESSFRYDKSVPEEIIELPIGLSLVDKVIGNNKRCTGCLAKGAVLCATCTGSGLYIDSIMESQGIIVKVRCLGCGGSGNIMCTECGGRGSLKSFQKERELHSLSIQDVKKKSQNREESKIEVEEVNKIQGRMDIESNDYSGAGANNRHDPVTPGTA